MFDRTIYLTQYMDVDDKITAQNLVLRPRVTEAAKYGDVSQLQGDTC